MIVDRKIEEMERTGHPVERSQRMAAIVVGVALLLMFVAAMFATFVHGNLFVPGDAAASANNILANELQFRLAILSFIVVVVLDVIVAWGLTVFFEPVDRSLSRLAGWFRLVYSAVYAVAIMELVHALRILSSAEALAALDTGPLQAQAMIALNAFSDGWDIGLAIFGVHLVLVGWLVLKADYMPKLLGALVLICGLGYLFDSVTGFLFPGFGLTVSLVTFVGEMLLGLWLLVKGLSTKQWAKLALEAA